MAKKRNDESAEVNMTPMIDVVFQLIIFFVVTLKMSKEINKEIVLEDGKNGETITAENLPVQTLIIEVSQRGRWSINNATLNEQTLRNIIRTRYKKFGSFPVLIRADKDAVHSHIKRVMDICTENGVWKVGFVAIKEQKDKTAKRRD